MRLTVPIAVPVLRGGPRRPMRRRGRAAVAWGVVAFALATVAFDSYADRTLAFRDPVYTAKERKYLAARAENGGPAVAVFGSSRTLFGFDGARAEATMRAGGVPAAAMNVGFPGCGIISQSLFLERLRKTAAPPDVVVVELFPAFLHDAPEGPVESSWLDPSRLSRAERRVVGDAVKATPDRRGRPGWDVYRRAVLRDVVPFFVAPGPVPLTDAFPGDERGFHRNTWRPRDEDERIRVVASQAEQYGRLLGPFRPTGPTARRTRAFDEAEAAAGTDLVFVLLPEASSMRSWYGPDAERTLKDYLAPFRAPVVDARAWVEDEDFFDTHHLTVRGAERFTDRLTAEVLIPRLRGAKR